LVARPSDGREIPERNPLNPLDDLWNGEPHRAPRLLG